MQLRHKVAEAYLDGCPPRVTSGQAPAQSRRALAPSLGDSLKAITAMTALIKALMSRGEGESAERESGARPKS